MTSRRVRVRDGDRSKRVYQGTGCLKVYGRRHPWNDDASDVASDVAERLAQGVEGIPAGLGGGPWWIGCPWEMAGPMSRADPRR
ncbi:hypothetical protein ACFU53_29270 [Streptomyces sp. NPDC057474]|uniref:hypothetical protein n=1 Tax=Streptomyces sp. NPDC057474 TaxID=3346144 RepID=UPI00368E12DE